MPLTLEQSQTLIAAAHAHARDSGLRVTVAVVDEGGLLQALGRMDGAPPLGAQIAEAKGSGAAVWRRRRSTRSAVQGRWPEVLRPRSAGVTQAAAAWAPTAPP